jgi:hypothetical protein
VLRGKFVLTTFLNTPPPPPLPTCRRSRAKPYRRNGEGQLEIGATSCASCHRVIDPPGFALEQFNSVGQWRETTENGAAIDSGGVLADGSKVDGPIALRNAILGRPDAFVRF